MLPLRFVVQIFGREPHEMAIAASIVESQGFDGVDINFGWYEAKQMQ